MRWVAIPQRGEPLAKERAHLLGDSLALLLGDGCKALGFEEVDASSLGAKVRFEAYED